MAVVDPQVPSDWTRTETETPRKQQFQHRHHDDWFVTIIQQATGPLTVIGSNGVGEVQFCRTVEGPALAEVYATAAMVVLSDPGAVVTTPDRVGATITDERDLPRGTCWR